MAYPKLVNATANNDYVISLEYDNGEVRAYDFSENFAHPFYKPLEDFNLFKNIAVNDGNIEWATGQDFCPFSLYDNSKPVKLVKTA